MENKKKKLLTASVLGLLAVTSVVSVTPLALAGGEIACYGVNKCKGTGECGGKGHSCAGKNACKGQGYIKVESKDACLGMKGGSLTPLAAH